MNILRKRICVWAFSLFALGCLTIVGSDCFHHHHKKNLVFVVAGQSNAISYIGPSKGKVLDFSPSGRVFVSNLLEYPKRVWSPSKLEPTQYSICWLYLGEKIAQSRPGTVTFINIARNSSSSRDWRHIYMWELVDAVQRYRPDAVLWHQGEHDHILSEEESYDNLKWLIKKTREKMPRLKWVIAINSRFPPSDHVPVRRAQQRAIQDGQALAGPDTDVLRMDPAIMDIDQIEVLHFVDDGFRQHGMLWYEALKKDGII
jgi:hypothetical protein